MPGDPTSIFISYSRTDSSFVDRLEADLKARNFRTWVDRSKLEGGQNWLDMIQRAIDGCQVLLIVLSPEAVISDFVKMEYRWAQSQHKRVIPLQYRSCRVPMDLNGVQWVKFEDAYEQGLKDLLLIITRISTTDSLPPILLPDQASFKVGNGFNVEEALRAESSLHVENTFNEEGGLKVEDRLNLATEEVGVEASEIKEAELVEPQPAQPELEPDLNELFREGIAARARNDLEAAATLWQQILDSDPDFRNGTLHREMKNLKKTLFSIRIQRLRDTAEYAHRAGEWGQEIGAWQALLGLKPEDKQAEERLPVAEHNQEYMSEYESARKFLRDGDSVAAKYALKMLWKDAPFYGDPSDLASKLGLRLPKTYDESKKRETLYFFLLLYGIAGVVGLVWGGIAGPFQSPPMSIALGAVSGFLTGIFLLTFIILLYYGVVGVAYVFRLATRYLKILFSGKHPSTSSTDPTINSAPRS